MMRSGERADKQSLQESLSWFPKGNLPVQLRITTFSRIEFTFETFRSLKLCLRECFAELGAREYSPLHSATVFP